MRDPVTAYVGLGANLGDPARALNDALASLAQLPATSVLARSSFYRSEPIDAGGPDYVNAVAAISTALDPYALLAQLQTIEQGAGRERPYRNAPRTLDLDLLLYGSAQVGSASLVVPHPRMRERAFVLRPLAEIAPHLVTGDELQAVASQRITALPPASSPA
ncbi:2-amino-4-hydroxy-6-hydroxymethyldihydropteridine diphosphokinase [Ramlibacter sp. XY19]|uniref:2-amino-4-hydroxy-6- hydroxymethyldihydropteridine diphosphokinase n=1 Tax=Ramlibacter paludis TaxID=2908000 RepID=UPI0023D9D30D|nr:2-amino-4-hydroxy-6-hydroxymethyldihydropteridine diphosphokinase [Ramlibacter paludis]MCG2594122.1 2-amino-4-hydroxy-6-hydroxymethyldihydropteridine diphosphokinase [Ramlibacter paludis]